MAELRDVLPMRAVFFAFVFGLLTQLVRSDTPANCTFEDIVGSWVLYETPRNGDHTLDCLNNKENAVNKVQLQLLKPNVAVDQYGNRGHWTLIYNQGFEITVNQRIYFAFSSYAQNGSEVLSFCDKTLAGWSHDTMTHNWACFQGKHMAQRAPKIHSQSFTKNLNGIYVSNTEMINSINKKQNSWTAKAYSWMEGMSHENLLKMRGGIKSKIHSRPPVAPASPLVRRQAEFLPDEWDWRNVSGVNYVPAVKNQGSCGSCYAFSSMGMLESRLRVATKNQLQVNLSPQDIVSCSAYSQGCEGGFPYLVAGKYAQDHGVVAEECYPYTGRDSTCSAAKKCGRTYVAKYRYVGGYYGACNEELMKISLVESGPLSVSFEVYPDFMHYAGGVYHRTGELFNQVNKYDPFELTNHAVLLVGYGTDAQTEEDYWIVKNSWGTKWGENGFFRIRRGVDECGIESIAVEVTPIP
ncbi:dipeptidyl peptidase 1-like [Daphnia carinata]|uniref:dipeptidyl peptidase 1-like n=1 Tax=Daphnia carinata TaxID=120202 RepID=UPI00257AEE7C|nr:dipeptidyl peptidase 1-like [Daphnia carinata]